MVWSWSRRVRTVVARRMVVVASTRRGCASDGGCIDASYARGRRAVRKKTGKKIKEKKSTFIHKAKAQLVIGRAQWAAA